MKTLVLSFITIFCYSIIYGQNQVFEITYGNTGKAEFAYDIIETPDGGYMMVGISMNNPNPTNSLDGKIKKTDTNGNLIWEQTYTGMQSTNDFLSSIVPKGSNYLVAGSRFVHSPIPPLYLKKQFWMLEITESGTLLQQKNFGGADDDAAEKIIATADGGFLMLGFTRTYGTQVGGQDVWLLKLNSNLDSVWSATYDLGGEDVGVDIMPFNNKYIILANSCIEDCNTPAGGLGFFKSNSFYLLIDTLGNLDTDYNVSLGLKNHFKTIKPTNDGGVIIVGATDAAALNYSPDLWVLKLDTGLDTVWTKLYGNANTYDGGRGIFQQTDSNYIVGGYSQSFVIPGVRDFDCPWVMKLNLNGDSIWSFISGTEDNDGIMNIIPASDGSIVATGYYGLDSKPESLFDLDLGEGKFYLLKLTDSLLTTVKKESQIGIIAVYPNPSECRFTLNIPADVPGSRSQIHVYNRVGALVWQSETGHKEVSIDLSTLPAGLYIMRVINDGKVFKDRIIIY